MIVLLHDRIALAQIVIASAHALIEPPQALIRRRTS